MKKIIQILLHCLLPYWGFSQVDTIVWQNKAPLPGQGRIDYASFVIDSNYYIVGGLGGNALAEVWKYSISNNNWDQMRDFPGGFVEEPTGFAIGGNGFVCCGFDSIKHDSIDSRLWEYYPQADTWQVKASYPGILSEAPISFVYNSNAFVGMGDGTSDFWRYNLTTDSWDSLSNLPEGARSECGVAVVDSFAYIIAGFNLTTGHDLAFKDIWRYNINHDHWDSIGVMPGLARSNVLFWHFDNIIIGGYGEQMDSLSNYYFGTDIYEYNVRSNKWDTLSCLNFPDSIADGATMGCFMLGKTGYFFGGYKTYVDPSYYNNMWSFDASRFFPPDTSTSISEVKNTISFSLYPNPAHGDKDFIISTSESGAVSFYDALGRLLDERKLNRGINNIKLMASDVIFYRAMLDDGNIINGKVLIE